MNRYYLSSLALEASRKMTREQATDLVNDLLQAQYDYEVTYPNKPTYRICLETYKETVIRRLIGEE
jgi:polyhydroxyalkanoate synthesis regulator phasin